MEKYEFEYRDLLILGAFWLSQTTKSATQRKNKMLYRTTHQKQKNEIGSLTREIKSVVLENYELE